MACYCTALLMQFYRKHIHESTSVGPDGWVGAGLEKAGPALHMSPFHLVHAIHHSFLKFPIKLSIKMVV